MQNNLNYEQIKLKKMKTRFLKVTFVAAVAVIGAFNVFYANKTGALSEITLTNVEALAYYVEGEFGDYECEAPYNAQCSVELGVPLKGYRYNFD